MEDQHQPAPADETPRPGTHESNRPPRKEQRQRRPERGNAERGAQSGQQGSRPQRRSGGNLGDGREGRKKRKEGDRRPAMAFGDGIERAVCTAFRHWEAETFPIQHRTGIATRRIMEVDRRASATLFCDGAHAGPHIWPDGELVYAPMDGETAELDDLASAPADAAEPTEGDESVELDALDSEATSETAIETDGSSDDTTDLADSGGPAD